jgi:hypothetical protein
VSPASRLETIQSLKERLRQLEQSHRPTRAAALSTGCALDRLLPGQGLVPGTLTEWLSAGEGAGAATLAFSVTAALLQKGGSLVVIDAPREFYPPAAAALGIPLQHTVVIQPENSTDALWALEQALRSSAVRVALGWVEEVDDRAFRRLQLAAEVGGGLGFLLRPAARRTDPSWADVRLLVDAAPTPQSSPGRRLYVQVLHCRGGAEGEALELELNYEADPVRLVPPVAHSALPSCPTGPW